MDSQDPDTNTRNLSIKTPLMGFDFFPPKHNLGDNVIRFKACKEPVQRLYFHVPSKLAMAANHKHRRTSKIPPSCVASFLFVVSFLQALFFLALPARFPPKSSTPSVLTGFQQHAKLFRLEQLERGASAEPPPSFFLVGGAGWVIQDAAIFSLPKSLPRSGGGDATSPTRHLGLAMFFFYLLLLLLFPVYGEKMLFCFFFESSIKYSVKKKKTKKKEGGGKRKEEEKNIYKFT